MRLFCRNDGAFFGGRENQGTVEIMKTKTAKTPQQWRDDWIVSVANGSNTMSARRLSSIEKRGGGLKAVAAAARKGKVHLVLFEDDEGHQVVAASNKPFKVVA